MPERRLVHTTNRFRSNDLQWSGLLILVIILLFSVTPLSAQDHDKIVVLLSGETEAYTIFSERLEQRNRDNPNSQSRLISYNITHQGIEKLHKIINDADIVVTAGIKSTIALYRINPPASHIATLLTREDYASNLRLHPNRTTKHCGIVIDQPLERIIRVIDRELPDIKRIGIIAPPDNDTPPSDDTDSSRSGIRIIRENLDENIHSTIKLLAKKEARAIVALHNKTVYNRDTARNILISSYHFNIPVIGYSSAFVKAGALISIYSSPESLADETYNYIKNIEKCKNGGVIYPGTYTIEVNPQVAKSLGINVSTDDLEKTINEGSKP